MSTLSGRHALVTGGGSGIGAAIALALAEAGAEVTITGRRAAALAGTAARHAAIRAIEGDVTDAASIASVFAAAGAERRAPEIVVANAGAAESRPFARTDGETWARMLSVNLTGVFNTFQAGLPGAAASGQGRLIAIASTAALKGYPYVTAYCAAKHGVLGLVRALALETAGKGVTVNAVCPGFAETPLLERSVSEITAKTGRSEDAARAALSATNPLGRFIRPEEVADAVLWLCGRGADAVTGQGISISGGET